MNTAKRVLFYILRHLLAGFIGTIGGTTAFIIAIGVLMVMYPQGAPWLTGEPVSVEYNSSPIVDHLIPGDTQTATPETPLQRYDPPVAHQAGDVFAYKGKDYNDVDFNWKVETFNVEKLDTYVYDNKEYKSRNGKFYVLTIQAKNDGNKYQYLTDAFSDFALFSKDDKRYIPNVYNLEYVSREKYDLADAENPGGRAVLVKAFDVPEQEYMFCQSLEQGLCITDIK